MLRVGLIGWRGMVGSVLMERMRAEEDFNGIEPIFFSTSNVGGSAPGEASGAGYRLFTKDMPQQSSRLSLAYYLAVLAFLALILRIVPGHGINAS